MIVFGHNSGLKHDKNTQFFLKMDRIEFSTRPLTEFKNIKNSLRYLAQNVYKLASFSAIHDIHSTFSQDQNILLLLFVNNKMPRLLLLKVRLLPKSTWTVR